MPVVSLRAQCLDSDPPESSSPASILGLLPEKIPLLVVDDDDSVLQVTRMVLSRFQFKGHALEILEANSASVAREILKTRTDIAVIFLDVVMESDDAGLRLVEFIRNELNNYSVRILLRTGQPGLAPERQVVEDYDINDYLLKSEVTQARMHIAMTTAIRGYLDILHARLLAQQVDVAEAQREMARRASVAKTQFLAHMSHEIRTPLNGINGIIQLLNDTHLAPDQTELVRDLTYAGDALLGVVNDVLDVAKIESGKFEIHVVDFSLKPLLDKISAIFSGSMKHKGISFTQSYSGELPNNLRGDAQRIQQIIINYLSNALKFTPPEGTIVLRAHCAKKDAGYELYAEVEDNGKGIQIDRLNDIFNAYEQESSQTALLFGGTGLGLSLSRTLAELMGGEVGVISELGKGSRFWLKVPLATHEPEVLDENADKGQSSQNVQKIILNLSVAVCEDDTTSMQVITRILKKSGIDVHGFENGQALLDANIAASMDVIILDYHMPILDGLATARALRAQGLDKPILALTAAVTEEERSECFASGMTNVLNKPIDWKALLAWLAKYNKE